MIIASCQCSFISISIYLRKCDEKIQHCLISNSIYLATKKQIIPHKNEPPSLNIIDHILGAL